MGEDGAAANSCTLSPAQEQRVIPLMCKYKIIIILLCYAGGHSKILVMGGGGGGRERKYYIEPNSIEFGGTGLLVNFGSWYTQLMNLYNQSNQ